MTLTKIKGKYNPYAMPEHIAGITFSLSAEASNARTLSCQLTDFNGKDIAFRGVVRAYFSDANGDTFAAAPAGGVAAGTDGVIREAIDNRYLDITSEADGDIDLVVTDASGVATHYLAFILPNGKLVISPAIVFA
jgi:hypothetical protein